MNRDVYTIVKQPIVTEKTTVATDHQNVYTFLVDLHANKIEIKKAIEKIFKVKVSKVNTQVRKGKARRVKYQWATGANWKRALVTLPEGQKIEIGAS